MFETITPDQILWFCIAIGCAGFGFGMIAGLVLDYYVTVRYLLDRVEELTRHILTMRKQGFVPQFEIEQPSEIDFTLLEQ